MADIYFFIGALLNVTFVTMLVFSLISRWNADVPGILTAARQSGWKLSGDQDEIGHRCCSVGRA